ncbi:MAG: alanine--tRNA ligase-related protein, partial [Candidatus Limnocylindrales bacterium]
MGDAYPVLVERSADVETILAREEGQFARTLDGGARLLDAALADLVPTGPDAPARVVGRRVEDLPSDAPLLPGEVAFRLYDTYGFPIDLTVELAAEAGVRTDQAGYRAALEAQRARSREGTRAGLSQHAEASSRYEAILHRSGPTAFLGYETTTAEAPVLAIFRDGLGYDELQGHGAAEVVLAATPFYAEGGGQVGDRGVLREPGGGSVVFEVEDTQKPVGGAMGGLIIHHGQLRGRLRVGASVEAAVDPERRARTMRNHTGTHLLHRALRNAVGPSARQAGSLVTPDGLRFDFPFERSLAAGELRAIELEVRRIIREDRPVHVAVMPMAQAIERGADAFFDEKYGEDVRTVAVDGYSLELCGGTHCRASGQVGGFVITGERSIGSGMRRVEALTGDGADAFLDAARSTLVTSAEAIGAQVATALPERIVELQGRVRDLERRVRSGSGGAPRAATLAAEAATVADGTRLVARAVDVPSAEAMKALARDVRGVMPEGVIALGLAGEAPELFITVSADLVARGLSAGDLARDAAPFIGGRGGGRPELAQARGTEAAGLARALDAVAAATARVLAEHPR